MIHDVESMKQQEEQTESVKPLVLGNTGFIEQEIQFFLDSFRSKSSSEMSELNIPIRDEKDR